MGDSSYTPLVMCPYCSEFLLPTPRSPLQLGIIPTVVDEHKEEWGNYSELDASTAGTFSFLGFRVEGQAFWRRTPAREQPRTSITFKADAASFFYTPLLLNLS